MRVGLISYDVPHLKTVQVATGLLRMWGSQVTVFGVHFIRRDASRLGPPRWADRPRQILEGQWVESAPDVDRWIPIDSWTSDSFATAPIRAELDSCDFLIHCTSKILPAWFLSGRRVLNAHPGLLPQVRGVDALKWSIVNGWPIGVTLHQVDARIDGGLILARSQVMQGPEDTLETTCRRAYRLEIKLLTESPRYLERASNQWTVSDDFPLSHDRIPEILESNLAEIYLASRKRIAGRTLAQLGFSHPADIQAYDGNKGSQMNRL